MARKQQLAPWLLVGVLAVVIALMLQWPGQPPWAASTLEHKSLPARQPDEEPRNRAVPPRRAPTEEVGQPQDGATTGAEPAMLDGRESDDDALGTTGHPSEQEGTGITGTTGRPDDPDDDRTTDRPSGSDVDTDAPPAAPSRPRVKQGLTLFAADALGAVQVEVRDKTGGFRRRYDVHGRHKGERIPTGTYWAKWRRVGDASWSASQRIVLQRGCDLRIVLALAGMSTVSMGNACR